MEPQLLERHSTLQIPEFRRTYFWGIEESWIQSDPVFGPYGVPKGRQRFGDLILVARCSASGPAPEVGGGRA